METPAIEKWQLGPAAADICLGIWLAGDGGDGCAESRRACRQRSGEDGASSRRTSGRREPSICSGRSTACPTPSAGTRTTFLWGPRGVYGRERDRDRRGGRSSLEKVYAVVEKRAHVIASVLNAEGAFDVFYCRGLKMPLEQMWPTVKNWH